MARATASDRAYFERVRQQSEQLDEPAVPASLAEMFERLEAIRRIHGSLAEAGVEGDGDGDLASHLAYLSRLRRIGSGGTDGA